MREVGPYDREADREDEPNPGLIAALRIIGFLVVVVLIGVLAHLAIWAWTF